VKVAGESEGGKAGTGSDLQVSLQQHRDERLDFEDLAAFLHNEIVEAEALLSKLAPLRRSTRTHGKRIVSCAVPVQRWHPPLRPLQLHYALSYPAGLRATGLKGGVGARHRDDACLFREQVLGAVVSRAQQLEGAALLDLVKEVPYVPASERRRIAYDDWEV